MNDLIIKAPTDTETAIARKIGQVFRYQKLHSQGGKTRFGDQTRQLAQALLEPLSRSVNTRLNQVNSGLTLAQRELLGHEALAAVHSRALDSARSINSTTSQWLEEGREDSSVFSLERVAQIAITEAKYLNELLTGLAAQVKGKKLRWKVGSNPCKACQSLAGKIVKPGQYFRANNGERVQQPPLHPSCNCEIEEV